MQSYNFSLKYENIFTFFPKKKKILYKLSLFSSEE